MKAIYIYKILLRSSGGPNPWCWEEKWFTAENKKSADKQANEAHCKVDDDVPVFVRKKKFMPKNHGEALPTRRVNAPHGYCAQETCTSCGNFWGTGGCRSRFGDKTGKDKFCHYKKNSFWKT